MELSIAAPGETQVQFKVKPNTKFSKVLDAYCTKKALDPTLIKCVSSYRCHVRKMVATRPIQICLVALSSQIIPAWSCLIICACFIASASGALYGNSYRPNMHFSS